MKQVLNAAEKSYKRLHKNGDYEAKDITEYRELIDATHEVFTKALSNGIADNVIPRAMKQSLEEDVFVFSALKTHAQLFEASRQLLDSEGKVKSFQTFNHDIKQIKASYNENYLYAEYNFATASAQQAANWSQVEEGKGRYNLQYRTAQDDRVRDDHAEMHGITLPIDDDFWDKYYPPNGWNCRCVAIEVLKDKYEVSNSEEANTKGDAATTKIGKNGKNKLEIFRFNPGKEKVVFPPNHPYRKLQDSKEVTAVAKESTSINLNDFIKKETPTNNEIKNILNKYAQNHSDDFRRGLETIKTSRTTSYMMQHSMSYKLATNEWVGKSTITISSHTFRNGFNPLEELKGALGAIKKGEKLTFNQEYAMESLWHEILHAKTKTRRFSLSKSQRQIMETVNQFVARHTYDEFIKRLGGEATNKQDILEKGYGYSSWVSDFRESINKSGKSEQDAVDFLKPHLFNDYSTIQQKVNLFLNR